MNWTQEDYRMYGRLAAMLFALADLAAFAGFMCLPIRLLMLWFLRPAEMAARAHARDMAVALDDPALEMALPTGEMPFDAATIAESFRALAAIFNTFAHLASLGADAAAWRRLPQPCQRVVLLLLRTPTPRPRFMDTS